MSSPPSLPPERTPAPLFRTQAIEQAGNRQFGTVLLLRPLSQRFLTAFCVLLAAAVLAFFALFNTTRKAQCAGVLVPTTGVLRVVPEQAGVITEARVREGQSVAAGEVLFALSSERSSSSIDATQRTVSALLQRRRDSYAGELTQAQQQTRQRADSLRRRATDLGLEVARLADQASMQRRRVTLAEQAYARFEALQKTNYLSLAQLQDKQAELLDQRLRLADLQRASATVKRELDNAEADLRDLVLQGQREAASLQRDMSEVEQELTESEARRDMLVRAPRAGMVSAITAQVGQSVAANTVLASVLPAGAELEAEIYATSRAVGFIRPGMTVLLRYQSYPYQKFGHYRASVHEVANTSVPPEQLRVPAPAGGEPLYRIRLKLDAQSVRAYGKPMPLKSGMLVDASVELEQRKLYEWVLEPLYSISGRL